MATATTLFDTQLNGDLLVREANALAATRAHSVLGKAILQSAGSKILDVSFIYSIFRGSHNKRKHQALEG